MNYRHAYHAGNFADVAKHLLLTRLIAYLKRKEKPFRVFDTHAGRGTYPLDADEALRTGEHEAGVSALLAHVEDLRGDPLFADYLDAVASDVAEGRYPGSPMIARRLLRPQDRLTAYELHPEDAAALKAAFAGDFQVKAIALDGWLALGSHLPPKERRGLVLVDPPFEKPSEIDDIVAGIGKAVRRWPGGIYAVWYPLKRRAAAEDLVARLTASAPGESLAAELLVEPYRAEPALVGSGLFVVNPPYVFAEEAGAILGRLATLLGRDARATAKVFKPSPESFRA